MAVSRPSKRAASVAEPTTEPDGPRASSRTRPPGKAASVAEPTTEPDGPRASSRTRPSNSAASVAEPTTEPDGPRAKGGRVRSRSRAAARAGKPVKPRPVGSHTPTAGGLAKAALPYVDGAESEVAQVYVSNSRGWALPPGDPAQDEAFLAGCAERGLSAYIHASLLVNLGSPTAATVERSAATLAHALARGAVIGASGVVFHAGSAVDEGHAGVAMKQVREALLPLLDRAAATGGPKLLVEPTAGGGRSLASKVEHLAPYLDAVDRHPWLGVCFDTCHAWAAGHDLGTPGGMAATLDALVAAVGPDRLWLVHANDSRDPCGSTRDRHETIGKGMIGEAAFGELMRHPATAGVPVVVETPTEGYVGHASDIAALKRLRALA